MRDSISWISLTRLLRGGAGHHGPGAGERTVHPGYCIGIAFCLCGTSWRVTISPKERKEMSPILPFNPFGKDFTDIVVGDLSVLRNTAEGWYVEYKGETVEQKNIAKSLSAFANHYGGWIFYGVQGSRDKRDRAAGFKGLEQSEVAVLIERIRNAAKDSISPSPYYEHAVLDGPCSEIGLAADRSIVVVLVPSGPHPPYIHIDGRIYRRVGDASDPKAETDRFILDQLWQRGQSAEAKLASFLQTEPMLSGDEGHLSRCELFLLPDPLGATGHRSNLKFNQFIEVMSEKAFGMGISCDNFFMMADGFIGRQVTTNDPYNLVFTWKHYFNGASVVSFTLTSTWLGGIEADNWLSKYKHEKQFLELLAKAGNNKGYLLDINQLFFLSVAAVNQQHRLMVAGGIRGPIYAKTVFRNIWRRVPYVDTERYMRLVSGYGLPVIQFDQEFAPPGVTFNSLVLIPEENLVDDEAQEENERLVRQLVRVSHIWGSMLSALGVPILAVLPTEGKEDDLGDSVEFWDAAQRACGIYQEQNEGST